ncbi:RuBisCO large subunit C-terminal-like domain-containing protein [Spirobacillus cienkowskii]|jgi:2,3-diketo-5-methylthiopentyl-1-phosphate enolase|uniref:Ribulose bisphosphate carboxylase large subunit C-terminal domain-containing protein n=1 Tax=Spirobacillus cienkowskii TaxID=495820 RepID=A0A369KTU9_9BACT|nr:MAG: hypothetical protein DCC88_11670 [Spirobacillus cienkowskii]
MKSAIKNQNLLAPLGNEPHAFAKFRIDSKKYSINLIEEIAIGQSLGAWDETHVSHAILQSKVAKIVSLESFSDFHEAVVAFPLNIWHRKLSWLLAILYGKMSFYEGVQLNSVWFSADCFDNKNLIGPKFSPESLRQLLGVQQKHPLLMGILKPNVGMNAKKIVSLYLEAAEAGVHILKDDEIRHDASPLDSLQRIEAVAQEAQKRNLKTLYAVHLQIDSANYIQHAKAFVEAGANALLVNVWTAGIEALQEIRKAVDVPILSHPALVGAFGSQEHNATIHPRVTLAQLIRAAGADLSLFPSPYGKLGLQKHIALDIAQHCLQTNQNWPICSTMPVLSAGIKQEHTALAKADFGTDFVLNAGTGIFTDSQGIQNSIQNFRKELDVL